MFLKNKSLFSKISQIKYLLLSDLVVIAENVNWFIIKQYLDKWSIVQVSLYII